MLAKVYVGMIENMMGTSLQLYDVGMCLSYSIVPRLPDLFNVAREKRGSLVRKIT